jgi:hypothetical protein
MPALTIHVYAPEARRFPSAQHSPGSLSLLDRDIHHILWTLWTCGHHYNQSYMCRQSSSLAPRSDLLATLCGTDLVRRANEIPSPSTGDGQGGGAHQRRLDTNRPPSRPSPARGEGAHAWSANRPPNGTDPLPERRHRPGEGGVHRGGHLGHPGRLTSDHELVRVGCPWFMGNAARREEHGGEGHHRCLTSG